MFAPKAALRSRATESALPRQIPLFRSGKLSAEPLCLTPHGVPAPLKISAADVAVGGIFFLSQKNRPPRRAAGESPAFPRRLPRRFLLCGCIIFFSFILFSFLFFSNLNLLFSSLRHNVRRKRHNVTSPPERHGEESRKDGSAAYCAVRTLPIIPVQQYSVFHDVFHV